MLLESCSSLDDRLRYLRYMLYCWGHVAKVGKYLRYEYFRWGLGHGTYMARVRNKRLAVGN